MEFRGIPLLLLRRATQGGSTPKSPDFGPFAWDLAEKRYGFFGLFGGQGGAKHGGKTEGGRPRNTTDYFALIALTKAKKYIFFQSAENISNNTPYQNILQRIVSNTTVVRSLC